MRTKHYLLLALISQAIIAVMNIVIFITALKRYSFYSLYYINIPALLATILLTIYYSRYIKKHNKKRSKVAIACVLVNIIYSIILFIDQNNIFYFFATGAIILINALFVMKYGLSNVKRMESEHSIYNLRLLILYSMGFSAIAIFLSSGNKLISTCFIALASILLMSSYWWLQNIYAKNS